MFGFEVWIAAFLFRHRLRTIVATFLFAFGFTSFAAAEPPCDELNRLYQEKYIDAFAIDRVSFQIGPNTNFACDGYDKNYIMARAINDLEVLKPQHKDVPYHFEDVAEVMQLEGKNLLKYIKDFSTESYAEASTVQDAGGLSTIFFSGKMIRSKERFRPTYTLVHEARHTVIDKNYGGQKVPNEPGHIFCTRGKHKGRRVCDKLLAKEPKMLWGSGNSHEFLFLWFARDHPLASPQIRKEAKAQLSYLATHMFNTLEPGILEYYGVELER